MSDLYVIFILAMPVNYEIVTDPEAPGGLLAKVEPNICGFLVEAENGDRAYQNALNVFDDTMPLTVRPGSWIGAKLADINSSATAGVRGFIGSSKQAAGK